MIFANTEKKTAGSSSKNIISIITSVFLLSIIPLIIISIFSRPSADDYNYAIDTYHLIQGGDWNLFSLLKAAFDVDMYFYNNWQGLYSSAFVLSLQPGIYGEQYYFLGAWVLMLLLFFSVCFLASNIVDGILGGGIKKRYIALFGLFVFTVLIQGLPSMLQGIYWFNGAWNYTFFFCLVLINSGLLIDYIFGRNKKWSLILSTVLSFLISGGNHVTAFLNILILMLATIGLLKKKKELLLTLSIAIFGFIIVLTAPGTMIRQGQELRQGLISTLVHCVWWLYKYICDWINIQFVFFMVLLIPVVYILVSCGNIDYNKFKIHPIFMVLAELMLLCGMMCVPFMAMGNLGNDRLKNIIWLTFMICSAINWMYFLFWSKVFISSRIFEVGWGHLGIVLGACLIVCFYTEANVYLAVEELINGNAVEYAIACDERYELMEQSPKGTVLHVDELPDSKMLKFSDLSSLTEFWTNTAWGDYYGIDVVVDYAEE